MMLRQVSAKNFRRMVTGSALLPPELLPVSRTPGLGAIVRLEVAYDEAEFQS